ncbi:competence protein ComEA helix-hairpin-helix repeat region [Gleimia europaea ACS-120-V-Col10b]|uniref:Competence protein ComEA helix-hairpin-helix repeat region n=2 Tax=Gleimia TaxID=2692113 RepID=A0A9W5VW82_9ACTO|nr:competence protein ComEA helix-hairpin-helix repeat region [Gleimia europaea ACS-120-V-Col10b]
MVALAVALVAVTAFSILRLSASAPAQDAILEDGTRQLRERIEAEGVDSRVTQPSEAELGPRPSGETAIFVQVTGAVNKPSVVQLRAGARGADAVEAAGGMSANAALASVNLAQLVSDGQHIHVLTNEELEKGGGSGMPRIVGAEATGGGGSDGAGAGGCIDLAVADSQTLQRLPGVGAALAECIIAYRSENGITKPEDVRAVSGIGPKTFAGFKDQLCQ